MQHQQVQSPYEEQASSKRIRDQFAKDAGDAADLLARLSAPQSTTPSAVPSPEGSPSRAHAMSQMYAPMSLGMPMHGGSYPGASPYVPHHHHSHHPGVILPPTFAMPSLPPSYQHQQHQEDQMGVPVPPHVLSLITSALTDALSTSYQQVMSSSPSDSNSEPSSPSVVPTKEQLEQTNKLNTVRTLEKLVRAEMDLLLEAKAGGVTLSESRRATRRQVLTITLRREIRRSGGRVVASLLRMLADNVDSRLKQLGVSQFLGSVQNSLSDSFEGLRPTKPRLVKGSTDTSRAGAGVKRGLNLSSASASRATSPKMTAATLATAQSANLHMAATSAALLSSLVSSSPYLATTTTTQTRSPLAFHLPPSAAGQFNPSALSHQLASAGHLQNLVSNFPAV